MSEPYFKVFLRSRFTISPKEPPSGLSLDGQTGIITGSNSGIGLEAARMLLDHKLSRLIMAVRSQGRGEDAANTLRRSYPTARVDVWSLDMLSYDSIRAFARRCTSDLDRIDFAILNAGAMYPEFTINPSTGHEEAFQVNYLSTALLSILMLPVMRQRRPKDHAGHLCITTSALGYTATFQNRNADPLIPSFDIKPEKWGIADLSERYAVAKLLGQLLMVKLKDCVSSDDVIVNLVEPGYIRGTGLARHMPTLLKPIGVLMGLLIGRSVRAGALTYIDAAVVQGVESHGSYLWNWSIAP